METYDPQRLIREVQVQLQIQGIEAETRPGSAKDAIVAASMLLNALGVTPAMDHAEALARAMGKPWPESDQ